MQFYLYNEDEANDINNYVSKGRSSETYLLRSAGIDPTVCAEQLKDESNIYGQYTLNCLETWNSESSFNMQVSNICHGICGELAEFLLIKDMTPNHKEEIKDELGDIFYYRQLLRYNFADNLAPTIAGFHGYDLDDVFTVIANLNDVGKKVAFHNKFSAEKTRTKYILAMIKLDTIVDTILDFHKLTVKEVMDYNVTKLQARHPNGFDANYTK